MDAKYADVLTDKIDEASLACLEALDNERVHAFVADAVRLCRPDSVIVCSDSPQDRAGIRRLAIENGEEAPLAVEGHTVHFDGFHDQARDKAATKYLLPEGVSLGAQLNATGRDDGLSEVRSLLEGAMEGKRLCVRFFCLGPTGSRFSISCVQCTDSAYVAHSEDLLYRPGYEQLKRLGPDGEFFRFLHSAGRLDERNTSADTAQRRIYIDILDDMVYSVNTQYGGNTIGLKKLALRLAIRKADREGWLAEHMFLMGVRGPRQRVTYLAGAFPSMCGKTSTAMLPGERIVGDDIAYLRAIDGRVRAVNVESGIFGIVENVNAHDDPVIHDCLRRPGEIIFSNVLVAGDRPYWLGMGEEIPDAGTNYSGRWHAGKTDSGGNPVTPSHRNARYTIAIGALENCDTRLDDPDGVPVAGILYGGRDSDTSVPVREAFDWTHGVITMGASIESETTAATLGSAGQRKFNIMSNQDFLAIGFGKYIRNHLDFAGKVERPPLVFATNYWLTGAGGGWLNGKLDKHVWIKWTERRVHGEVQAIEGPTGLLPTYEDLKALFAAVLESDYSRDDYVEQFSIRTAKNLEKLDRLRDHFGGMADLPPVVAETLAAQRRRLEDLQAAKGDLVSPFDL